MNADQQLLFEFSGKLDISVNYRSREELLNDDRYVSPMPMRVSLESGGGGEEVQSSSLWTSLHHAKPKPT